MQRHIAGEQHSHDSQTLRVKTEGSLAMPRNNRIPSTTQERPKVHRCTHCEPRTATQDAHGLFYIEIICLGDNGTTSF